MKVRTQPLLDVWEWQCHAACRGMASSVFFSPTGERGEARRRREEGARAVCRSCPVSSVCRTFAESFGEQYGVWGGITESERRQRGQGDGKGR
ncbi:WhiB family transcriptional regulator [Streptomyces sp. NPDC048521]|uniref:WhiB family transcriptional regulator n=1 Tax=Streptomyces sp. NPDC048521 TaxID=3365566 RepID=UPI0037126449